MTRNGHCSEHDRQRLYSDRCDEADSQKRDLVARRSRMRMVQGDQMVLVPRTASSHSRRSTRKRVSQRIRNIPRRIQCRTAIPASVSHAIRVVKLRGEGLTSKMYFFPSNSSRLHPVSRQNSVPTKQISPVRRQTTVGVPENEMSLFSSTRVRWKVRSTKVCQVAASEMASQSVKLNAPHPPPIVASAERSNLVGKSPARE